MALLLAIAATPLAALLALPEVFVRETGLLLQWDPGIWVCTAALTNGSFEQDTNSSKAVVARVGIDQPVEGIFFHIDPHMLRTCHPGIRASEYPGPRDTITVL